MSLKIWLVDCVLAIAVVFLGMKAYGVWSKWDQGPSKIASIQKPMPWPEKAISRGAMPPESDYELVVSDNLFTESRSEPKPEEEKKPSVDAAEPKAAGKSLDLLEWTYQRTDLYGVVIVDDHKEALIGEVAANTGKTAGESVVKRAKIGDIVGRFKVKEIYAMSVLLEAGGYEWPVSLFDEKKPKKREPVKKTTVPVVVGAESKPGTGEVSGVGKEKEKEPLPEPPATKGAAPDKEQKNLQRTIPVPDNFRPEATQKQFEKSPNLNRLGSDQR
jgi:hypothetical protein